MTQVANSYSIQMFITKPRLIIFYLFFLAFFTYSQADEEEEKEGCHYPPPVLCKSLSFGIVQSNTPPLAKLEGEPSSFVHGCVNVITGSFCDSSIDLIIHHGTDPLCIERSFVGSHLKEGTLGVSWFMKHASEISIEKKHSGKLVQGTLQEDYGGVLLFEKQLDSKKDSFDHVPLKEGFLSKGVTNTSQGALSGQTNVKNQSLSAISPNICSVKTGSYRVKTYMRFPFSKDKAYRLNYEQKDSGNAFFYKHRYVGNKSQLAVACIANKNKEIKESVEIPLISRKSLKKNPKVCINSADGRWVHYTFDKTKDKFYLLTGVERSDGPKEIYRYQRINDRDFGGIRYITKKELPEGRILRAEYYEDRDVDVLGQQIKLGDRDPQVYRVRSLKAPAGVDDTCVPIYHFVYHLDVNDRELDRILYSFRSGGCDVYDALRNKTYYGFNADHRLTTIKKFDSDGSLYTTEKLCWGENDSPEATCLLSRSFEQEGSPIFARTYQYDSAGNVLEDIIYGNLSGNNQVALALKPDGTPMDNGCEAYCKRLVYSDDGHNCLLEESNGLQTTWYEYVPRTTNIAAKFQVAGGEIVRRSFYRYNDDAALIKEITDDGHSRDINDLNGVTERFITNYKQSQTYPIAYPLVIEKKCLDIDTGDELLIHKVVNTYTNQAKIATQEHYDSTGQYCYTLSWIYDQMGNVIEEANAIGQKIVRKYDQNSNCVFEQGPRGDCHKEYVYDFMNRLICEKEIHQDQNHRVVSHRYDLVGNRIATVDVYGNETNIEYDAFMRPVRIIHPAAQDESGAYVRLVEERKFDAMSNVVVEKDSLGVEKKMTYTIRGQLVDVLYPDGTTEKNTYDLNGSLIEAKATNGTITRYEYDFLGRIIGSIIDADDIVSKKSIVYRGSRVAKEIDPMGIETEYTYCPDGKLKRKQKGEAVIDYIYDPLGRVAKTVAYDSDNSGVVKTFQYDLLNRVVDEREEDFQGNVILKQTYVFDISGNISEVITYDTAGVVTRATSYDSHGEPVVTTDAEGHQTITTVRYDYYNAIGQNVPYMEVTDPLGNTSVIIQDVLDRSAMTIKKNAFGKPLQQQANRYDKSGNLRMIVDTVISSIEQDRDVVSYLNYDICGRLTECCEAFGTPEQKITKLTYNNVGQKHKLIKNDGTFIEHHYDSRGRLIALKSSDETVNYTYTYDLNDNPLQVEDHINGLLTTRHFDSSNHIIEENLGNNLSLRYLNDKLGRTVQLTLPDDSSIVYRYESSKMKEISRLNSSGASSYKHSYDNYDLSGLLLRTTLPGATGSVQYGYDRLGRVKEINASKWKETIPTYDPIGNILEKRIDDALGESITGYSYDDLYQLTGEKGDHPHRYIYDSLYNRREKDGKPHELNNLHQLVDDGTYRYAYDRNGNLCQKKNQDKEYTYCYDALDRLVTYISADQKVCYLYDDNNRRLSKTYYSKTQSGEWGKMKVERYLYQEQNEIGAVDEQGKIFQLRILGEGRGAEIGAAVAMEFDNKLYVPIHDHIGNVACLFDGTTGEQVECYRYTAFGESEQQETINPWRFSSKRHDEETQFIYFGRRYYDAGTGRWVTPDPIGREGGPNLYAYVLNRPLTHVDFYGLVGVGGTSSLGSVFSTVCSFIADIITLPGKIINFLGYNLVPIPYVKDVVEFGGWCLAGRNPSEYVPSWNKPHSKLVKHEGYGYESPDIRHILYCGIGTTETEFRERMAEFSKNYGGVTVWGVYNDTQGFALDLLEVACQKVGIPVRAQAIAEKATQAVVNLMGEYRETGTLFVEAHSQGAETVNNLSQGLRSMMSVNAIGPARVLATQRFKGATNYINRCDLVPLADPVGLVRGILQHNVHYLPTTGCPVKDHLYNSRNFNQIRAFEGYGVVNKYGGIE